MYRLFRYSKKFTLKVLHAVIQISSLLFAAVGLAAVFDYHNRSGIPNMYSMHSWLGLITVILFGIQVVFFVSACAKFNSEAYKP